MNTVFWCLVRDLPRKPIIREALWLLMSIEGRIEESLLMSGFRWSSWTYVQPSSQKHLAGISFR